MSVKEQITANFMNYGVHAVSDFTMQDAINQAQRLDKDKFDCLAKGNEIIVNPRGAGIGKSLNYKLAGHFMTLFGEHLPIEEFDRLNVDPDSFSIMFDESIFLELAKRLNIPNFYKQMDNTNLAVSRAYTTALNTSLASSNLTWMFRLLSKQDSIITRAILSDKYSNFPNSRVLELFNAHLGNKGYEYGDGYALTIPQITHDYTRVNIVFAPYKSANDGYYTTGVGLTADETGKGAIKISLISIRGRCMNCARHITTSIVHSENRFSSSTMSLQVASGINSAIEQAEVMSNKIDEASLTKVDDLETMLKNIALAEAWGHYTVTENKRKKDKINETVMRTMLLGTENATNFMAVVNGITYAGKTIGEQNRELGETIEEFGGNLLMNFSPALIRNYQ